MALVDIGNKVLGASGVQFPPANNKAVCRYQNDSGFNLTVDKLFGYWSNAYASAKTKAVIYSDNLGSPNTLLASSDEDTGIIIGWNTFTFSTPLVVNNGDFIWIGVISDTGMSSFQNRTAPAGTIKYNADTYADGPAATFGTPSNASFEYPVYVQGDDGVGGGWDVSLIRGSINDDAFEMFGSYGGEGALNTRERQRLKSLGFDNWESYLASLGYTGSVVDMKYQWLRDSGYQGSLNDLLYSYFNT